MPESLRAEWKIQAVSRAPGPGRLWSWDPARPPVALARGLCFTLPVLGPSACWNLAGTCRGA